MSVTIDSLLGLFERDLNKLREEINLYPDEKSVWKIDGRIKNSGGTLSLHLCGNLQHYFGAVLGHSGYKRNRELEFAARNIPRSVLLEEIGKARSAVQNVLQNIEEAELEKEYPENVFNRPMTTGFFLIHLQGHLNYHLQVNYHRRLV